MCHWDHFDAASTIVMIWLNCTVQCSEIIFVKSTFFLEALVSILQWRFSKILLRIRNHFFFNLSIQGSENYRVIKAEIRTPWILKTTLNSYSILHPSLGNPLIFWTCLPSNNSVSPNKAKKTLISYLDILRLEQWTTNWLFTK